MEFERIFISRTYCGVFSSGVFQLDSEDDFLGEFARHNAVFLGSLDLFESRYFLESQDRGFELMIKQEIISREDFSSYFGRDMRVKYQNQIEVSSGRHFEFIHFPRSLQLLLQSGNYLEMIRCCEKSKGFKLMTASRNQGA